MQEYRKPEYEVILTPQLDLPYALQGKDVQVLVSAKYFFGGPVKGATLKFSGDANGEVKLNENGEATITLPNAVGTETPQDRTLSLNARVIDEANRIVESSTSIFAPYALIRPTLSFDKSVYKLQETAKIAVRTRDPLGAGVSAKARVRLYFTRKTRVKNRETLRTEETYQEVNFFDQTVHHGSLWRGGIVGEIGARRLHSRRSFERGRQQSRQFERNAHLGFEQRARLLGQLRVSRY